MFNFYISIDRNSKMTICGHFYFKTAIFDLKSKIPNFVFFSTSDHRLEVAFSTISDHAGWTPMVNSIPRNKNYCSPEPSSDLTWSNILRKIKNIIKRETVHLQIQKFCQLSRNGTFHFSQCENIAYVGFINVSDFWLVSQSEKSWLFKYENGPDGYFTAEMTERNRHWKGVSKWYRLEGPQPIISRLESANQKAIINLKTCLSRWNTVNEEDST